MFPNHRLGASEEYFDYPDNDTLHTERGIDPDNLPRFTTSSAFRRKLRNLTSTNLHQLFVDLGRNDVVGALSDAVAMVSDTPSSMTLDHIMQAFDSAYNAHRLPMEFSALDTIDVLCQAGLHSDSTSMFRMLLASRVPSPQESNSIVHASIFTTLIDPTVSVGWLGLFVSKAVGAMVADPTSAVPYLVLQEVLPPAVRAPSEDDMAPSLLPAALRIPVNHVFCERIVETRNATAISILLNCLRNVPVCPVRLGPVTRSEHNDTGADPASPAYSDPVPLPRLEQFGPRHERQWAPGSRITVELHDMVLPLIMHLGYLPTFRTPLVHGGMTPDYETGDDLCIWDAVLTSPAFHRRLLHCAMRRYGHASSLAAVAMAWHRMPALTRSAFMTDVVQSVLTQPVESTRTFLGTRGLKGIVDELSGCAYADVPQYVKGIPSMEAFLANVTVALCNAFANKIVLLHRVPHRNRLIFVNIDNSGDALFLEMLHRLLVTTRLVETVIALDPGALMQTVRVSDVGVATDFPRMTSFAILIAERLSQDDDFTDNTASIDGALETLIEGYDLKEELARLPWRTALLQKHLVFGGLRCAWVRACVRPRQVSDVVSTEPKRQCHDAL